MAMAKSGFRRLGTRQIISKTVLLEGGQFEQA